MNPHEAECPNCEATICLRCIALDKRMDPDGLDGCEDCERGVRRTERAKRLHFERDHRNHAGQERGEVRDASD